ncbi:MAG TPA: hypothetical protein PK819_12540, partial [Thermomicrobiales bacterium]|nr:hypothetical protein [Thermomicrobiales bacterium]
MMRIVVFSPSIVSDIGNPQATTVRALCQALVDAGCDVTHLEEQGNRHLTRMLTARGSAPMRAFNLAYPGIRYRQYEMLTGIKRSVWFGRELAIADALVVFPGVPDGVMEEAVGFAVPQVVRFLPDLVEIDGMSADDVFAAAVNVVANNDVVRQRNLTLIWDQDLRATGRVICCGAETPGAAEYVPEVA